MRKKIKSISLTAFFILNFNLNAQTVVADSVHLKVEKTEEKKEQKKKWYEQINLRGYTQIRYNKLLETNPDLGCEQCDRSWGGNNSFFYKTSKTNFFWKCA